MFNRSLLALSLLAFAGGGAARADCLALSGATIHTISDRGTLAQATLVARDGRIVELGDVDVPEDCEHLDLSGRFVTPGLVDTNVHLILMTVPEFFIKYEDRLTEIAVESAQVGLKYGMTTMADTWGPLEPLLEARDRIRRGEVPGGRILIAGNIVGTGGPFSSYFMGSWPVAGSSLRYGGWVHPAIRQRIDALWEAGAGPELLAMTPEEVADAMRSYIAKGVDFLKVGVSGHGLGTVEPLMFSKEALLGMRAVAREAEIPFSTHTFSVESLRLAVEVDSDLLIHPNVMSFGYSSASEPQRRAVRELVKEIAERKIASGLMAIPSRRNLERTLNWNPAREQKADPHLHRILRERQLPLLDTQLDEFLEQGAEGLRVWLDAGVVFTLATDQGPEALELGPVVWGRLGRAHFERMEALQDLGVGQLRILQAATRNGAEAYGLGTETGSLEVGKSADLLVLSADPLQDITNLRLIERVIFAGQVVDREALPTNRVLDYDPEGEWPY